MKTVEIRHRFTNAVLYSTEVDDDDPFPVRTALTRANLTDANLTRANLTDANLTRADLAGANLARADLAGANLAGADLTRANLTDANLAGADLADANLARANLAGADLTRANLTDANLTEVREDVRAVLDLAPAEVPGLLSAIVEGRVDGSCYEGDCACLVGTIANVRGCAYTNLGPLTPNSDRAAEKWFLAIRRGQTPESCPICAITYDWIAEWLAERGQGPWIEEVR